MSSQASREGRYQKALTARRLKSASPSDEELFELVASGADEELQAIETLVHRYEVASYRAVRARLEGIKDARSVAVELTEEAWGGVVALAKTKPPGELFADYLYRQLYNTCSRRLAREKVNAGDDDCSWGTFLLERDGTKLLTILIRREFRAPDLWVATQVWDKLDRTEVCAFVLDMRHLDYVRSPATFFVAIPLVFWRRHRKTVHLIRLGPRATAIASIYIVLPIVRDFFPELLADHKGPISPMGSRS